MADRPPIPAPPPEPWAAMSLEQRIAANGPTTMVYGDRNLPDPKDPGWGDWTEAATGDVYRMIEVHGPIQVDGEPDRCEDGFLGLDSEGHPFTVYSRYERDPSAADGLAASATPYGFEKARK